MTSIGSFSTKPSRFAGEGKEQSRPKTKAVKLHSSGRQVAQIPMDVNRAVPTESKRNVLYSAKVSHSVSELRFGQFVFLNGARGSTKKKNGNSAK